MPDIVGLHEDAQGQGQGGDFGYKGAHGGWQMPKGAKQNMGGELGENGVNEVEKRIIKTILM